MGFLKMDNDSLSYMIGSAKLLGYNVYCNEISRDSQHTLDSATEGVLAPLEKTPSPDFPLASCNNI